MKKETGKFEDFVLGLKELEAASIFDSQTVRAMVKVFIEKEYFWFDTQWNDVQKMIDDANNAEKKDAEETNAI